MPIPDSILAREYSLVMERAYAFAPINGDLTKWKGFVGAIKDEGEIPVEVEIFLPDTFPEDPPIVKIITAITHPNVTRNGILEMRMLARWRSSYHLFQVIVEIMRLFSKVPVRAVEAAPKIKKTAEEINPLINQEKQLSIILQNKKKELQEIKDKKQSKLTNRTLKQEKKKHLDDEILNVESKLFAVEQQFEDYEISSIEFAKKFYILKKRLLLLESQT